MTSALTLLPFLRDRLLSRIRIPPSTPLILAFNLLPYNRSCIPVLNFIHPLLSSILQVRNLIVILIKRLPRLFQFALHP